MSWARDAAEQWCVGGMGSKFNGGLWEVTLCDPSLPGRPGRGLPHSGHTVSPPNKGPHCAEGTGRSWDGARSTLAAPRHQHLRVSVISANPLRGDRCRRPQTERLLGCEKSHTLVFPKRPLCERKVDSAANWAVIFGRG